MTPHEEELQEQIAGLENDLADANERIDQLRSELADMTQLAADYKKANTWLEQQLRELRSAE